MWETVYEITAKIAIVESIVMGVMLIYATYKLIIMTEFYETRIKRKA